MAHQVRALAPKPTRVKELTAQAYHGRLTHTQEWGSNVLTATFRAAPWLVCSMLMRDSYLSTKFVEVTCFRVFVVMVAECWVWFL